MKPFDGALLSFYMVIYGIFRIVIEFFRGDARGYIGFLSTSQIIATIAIISGIFLYLQRRMRS